MHRYPERKLGYRGTVSGQGWHVIFKYHTRYGNMLGYNRTRVIFTCIFAECLGRQTNITIGRHYNDVIMGAIASQITTLTIVFSTVYLDTDQRKHESSASLAFVQGIHRRSVNSPHKWPVARKMFPFDDVIMAEAERLSLGLPDCCYNSWRLSDCPICDTSCLDDVIKRTHFPR